VFRRGNHEGSSALALGLIESVEWLLSANADIRVGLK
jgi:hypothetical protein